MGKYSKKQKKHKKKNGRSTLVVLLAVLSIILAVLICLAISLSRRQVAELPKTDPTEQTAQTTQSTEAATEQTIDVHPEETETEPKFIELSDGLTIHYISSYAGMYMEDGSNEIVSNVLMAVLENTSEQDLQLARIVVEYADFTAEFEVTNLPSGEKVVLLEKNRHSATDEAYQNIQVKNVVYFPEAMSLQEERLRITGSNGTLMVENISGEDIPGDIYIYYKHSAADLLYGGITYRVAVRGGLKAGQSNTVIAGHYTPDTCRILQADCGD